MFYVGQKVVHVGWGRRSLREWFDELRYPMKATDPIVGTIYTVVNIISDRDEPSIELLECPAPEEKHWLAGWHASGFRPAVTAKTDISVFTKMLKPRRTKQPA